MQRGFHSAEGTRLSRFRSPRWPVRSGFVSGPYGSDRRDRDGLDSAAPIGPGSTAPTATNTARREGYSYHLLQQGQRPEDSWRFASLGIPSKTLPVRRI